VKSRADEKCVDKWGAGSVRCGDYVELHAIFKMGLVCFDASER
jgi:hypothetical protein